MITIELLQQEIANLQKQEQAALETVFMARGAIQAYGALLEKLKTEQADNTPQTAAEVPPSDTNPLTGQTSYIVENATEGDKQTESSAQT